MEIPVTKLPDGRSAKIVAGPDGKPLGFPAEMSDDAILGIMKQKFPPPGPEGTWNNPDTTTASGQVMDAAHGALTGLGKGVLDVAGMPGTIDDAMHSGLDWLARKGQKLITGSEPTPMADMPGAQHSPLSAQAIQSAVESQTGKFYQPETRAGRAAENVAEFVPSAAAMPGALLPKVAKYGVLPGAAAEAAGEATEGTRYEPYARAGAALAAGGGAAALSRPAATGRVIRNTMPNLTEPQMQAAQALMNDAIRMGSPITLAEAVQQVTGSATRMGDLQRVVEQSERGGPIMREFMAGRQEGVQQAGNNALNRVGPESSAPSQIPGAVQEAAQGAIDQSRQTINRLADPHYAAARGQSIPPADFARISGNPTFQEALRRVQADPIKYAEIEHLPVNSIEVVDAVKKEMDRLIENAANPLNPNRDNYLSSLAGRGRAAVVDEATAASPEYGRALEIGAQGREQVLSPMQRGPLGQLAGTDSFVKQSNIVMPQNPLPGSANEVQVAIRRLARQNPDAARDIVRTKLGQIFNESTQDLSAGPNQWGGARFRAVAGGNPQQLQNLEAAVTEVAGPDAWDGLQRALNVFEAQGWRNPAGSQTAYNLMIQQELKKGGVLGTVVSEAASPGGWLTKAKKLYEDFRYGRNTEALAHLLTDPQAVRRLRALALLPNNSPRAQALATVLAMQAETARTSSAPRGQSQPRLAAPAAP